MFKILEKRKLSVMTPTSLLSKDRMLTRMASRTWYMQE